MKTSPLDDWIARKITEHSPRAFSPGALTEYQWEKLQDTFDYVCAKSRFYRERLGARSAKKLHRIEDIRELPFTTPEDLSQSGHEFLCVSQSEVERVVTAPLPGSNDDVKRIFFSAEDLELTMDFFHHGMTTLIKPGQRVLILLPGSGPFGVADLLSKGIARAGAEGIIHGIITNPSTTIREITQKNIDCVVGIPTQVAALAQHKDAKDIPRGRMKSVLLSGEFVSSACIGAIRAAWYCPVFTHYGSVEMGYGGGVDCEAFSGYHLREADLLFEIIDPRNGQHVPEGRYGEIVFTTLTRRAMPLIRYRSGDWARFLPGRCPCGSILRRMDRVMGKSG